MSNSLSRKELIELLDCAKSSKERNKAVKLLKRFDPVPNYDYDDHGKRANFQLKEFNYVLAFVCGRCSKVKQAKTKVFWNVPLENGKTLKKHICTGCYNQLLEGEEVTRLRTNHQRQGLVPKGMGFGLTDGVTDYSHLRRDINAGPGGASSSSSTLR
ncbi:unnamed protein product [Amoebophrya sp. A25]|nr:unnamed protein product [Amoebophrya sp. A25]|eukprot:GSA25T00019503001.1